MTERRTGCARHMVCRHFVRVPLPGSTRISPATARAVRRTGGAALRPGGGASVPSHTATMRIVALRRQGLLLSPCSRNDTYRFGSAAALTALTAPADSPRHDVTWWHPWPVVRPMPLTGAPARQRGPGELTLRSRGRRHSGGCGGRLTCRCHDAPAGLKARDERLSGRPPAAGQGQTTAGATTSSGAVGRPCRRGPGHTSPGAQAAAWLLHGGCADTADGRGSRCGCWSWRTRRCSRAP